MKIRFLIPCILVCMSFGSFGQGKPDKNFERFAMKEDSLFRLDYRKRNVKDYQKQLSRFLTRYNKLPDSTQKYYSGNLVSGYYNLSCTYSILNDKQPALEYLKKAIQAGWYDYDHICQDKDLDNIRNEQEFQSMVTPLRFVSDYMFILKKAEKYNPSDNRSLPKWTYQSADNPNLVALRKAFNLDSIAGQGSDVFRMINLMQWVHYLVPHDGEKGNPVVENAMSMIKECHRDHKTLNCRGLALVLNECYLAMGYKSRIVTCLPKDSLKMDQDCHVIDIVYSDSLKKWLWMDPTFDGYVMKENGDPLGIEEVRERIIHDKPLIINPDMNWNRQVSETKQYYLYHYMAKNLYMLECPVNSEYNMETRAPGKTVEYIKLIPLDYFEQSIPMTSSTSRDTKFTIQTYMTNNDALFWKAP